MLCLGIVSIFFVVELVYLSCALHLSAVGLKLHHPMGEGEGDPNIFLYISSSWVKIWLLTENQLPRLPGSGLKV